MSTTDTLDEILSVFSQQSDDKGITLTWSSKDSITEAKAKIQSLITEARIEELELVEVMFETNDNPLGDIADRITKLKGGKS